MSQLNPRIDKFGIVLLVVAFILMLYAFIKIIFGGYSRLTFIVFYIGTLWFIAWFIYQYGYRRYRLRKKQDDQVLKT
jgi:fatty-acid desaturase